MDRMIKGSKVILKPMTPQDVPVFYRMATQSDATQFWYGELYGDKIPTLKEFVRDWKPHYFNGKDPLLGKCFFIIVNNKRIGQVNYNNVEKQRAELDILIADLKNWNKGYGSDAIKALTKYLFEKLGLKKVWIAAIKKNPRAVSAYKKAGLKPVKPWKELKKDDEWKNKNLEDYVFLKEIRN